MIIKELNIGSFGKIKNTKIKFDKGLNIIYGKNESGKSTIQSFIKAFLYGMNSQKKSIRENDRKRYLPWSGENAFGHLYIKSNNQDSYIINRTFGKSKKDDYSQIIDELTGKEVDNINTDAPGEDIFGIKEESFEKTILFRQLSSKISHHKNDEIMTRLINLQESADEDISYHKAIDRLQEAKKTLSNIRKNGEIDKLEKRLISLSEEIRQSKEIYKESIKCRIELNKLYKEKKDIEKDIKVIETKDQENTINKLLNEYIALYEYIENLNALLSKKEANNHVTIEALNLKKSILNSQKRNNTILNIISITILITGLICGLSINKLWFILSFLGLIINIFMISKLKNININTDNIGETIEAMKIANEKNPIDDSMVEVQNRKRHITDQLQEMGIYDIEIKSRKYNTSGNIEEENLYNKLKAKNQNLIEIEKDIIYIENLIKNSFNQKRNPIVIEEEIKNTNINLKRLRQKLENIDIAIRVLKEAFKELQENFGDKLNAKVGQIVKNITFDKYKNIKISEDYEIKILLNESTQIKELDYFSNATLDQIYFALRLAIIELIFEQIGNPPLILDDAFVQYDNSRLNPVLDYLFKYSKTGQVLLFTCQQREIDYFKNYLNTKIIYL